MTGIRLAGVIIPIIAAIGVVVKMQQLVISELRTDLAKANSQIIGYEELARFNARVKTANVEWATAEKDLGESDAPLSDYMSGVARRVWP